MCSTCPYYCGITLPSPRPLTSPPPINFRLKPAAHLRKELSKLPCEAREAISSAVSSSVRLSFRENFASRGEISSIKHVRYFPHGLARRKTHRTHDETAELITSRGSCLSSLKCAAGFTVPHYRKLTLV